jgi:hypothetical protein
MSIIAKFVVVLDYINLYKHGRWKIRKLNNK